MGKPSGVCFYEGPSRLDGSPIIGVATFNTENEKTGNLVQTWILRADLTPIQAINMGADYSICGNCPLKGVVRDTNKDRACYVAVQNAPTSVSSGYHRHIYPHVSEVDIAKLIGDAGFRYGSYGDPTAIPLSSWKPLTQEVKEGNARAGYSHQWHRKKFQFWRTRLMASTHSESENRKAWAMGWRTFRTIMDVSERMPEEIICPASAEGDYRRTCETCGACNGRASMGDLRRNIAIVVHGDKGRRNALTKLTERIALPVI